MDGAKELQELFDSTSPSFQIDLARSSQYAEEVQDHRNEHDRPDYPQAPA
jgi:hypothetical protein